MPLYSSIIGQCSECCAVTCEAPTVTATSISATLVCERATASKSKQGQPENPESLSGIPVSVPPRIYRGCSGSGEITVTSVPLNYDEEGPTGCDDCDPESGGGFFAYSYKASGKYLVDLDGAVVSYGKMQYGSGSSKCEIGSYGSEIDTAFGAAPGTQQECPEFPLESAEGDSASVGLTTATITGCGCIGALGSLGAAQSIGSISYALTDEFTTEALVTHTKDSLSSFSSGGCSSYFYLSPNEDACIIYRGRYKIALPASSAVTESVDFLVRLKKTYTPAGGGAPVVEYANVTVPYDGTATESDWYDLLEPDDPGTTTIEIVRGTLLVLSFKFPIPVVRARLGTCYKITWKKRTTPIGGGAPTDEDLEWQWDGEIPEDYDPEDSSTWPISPTYYYPTPADGGTISIVDVLAECSDCE
jgi:hypothetical protein